jgi:lincosamide nucleotidyltransferase A/C/D/E
MLRDPALDNRSADDIDELTMRGLKIYETALKAVLEPDQNGKYVAIHVDSGDYYIGDGATDAGRELHGHHPRDGQMVLHKIGSDPEYGLAARLFSDGEYMVPPEQDPRPREMRAPDVVDVLDLLEAGGIDVWVDGGWGVDALLGEQSRVHGDLDIVLSHKDVPMLRALLKTGGYLDIRGETRNPNFVVGDGKGHEVDVHSFTLDSEGHHIFGCNYPIHSLTGAGSVNGQPVKCISAEWIVQTHTGYTLHEKDFRDVSALHRRFGIKIPDDYADWLQPSQDTPSPA